MEVSRRIELTKMLHTNAIDFEFIQETQRVVFDGSSHGVGLALRKSYKFSRVVVDDFD